MKPAISPLQGLLIALFVMHWIAARYSVSQPLCDFWRGFLCLVLWFLVLGFLGFFFLFSQEPVALRSVPYNGIIT